MTKPSKRNQFFFQRAAVWCEAAGEMRRIPFRAALLNFSVGGDGCARYCAYDLLGSDEAA